MDKTQETTGQAPEEGGMKRASLVLLSWKLLPIFGALLLSSGMLAAWFTGMAYASALRQDTQPGASAAAQFEIFKTNDPTIFTIGPGSSIPNKYIISVRINALPYPALLTVRDILPAGITISDVQATDWNCGIFSNRTEISCNYNGAPDKYPGIGQPYPAIFINLNIASSVASQVTNKADLYIDGNYFSSSLPLITPVDSVDLRIKKIVSRQFADVGESLYYNIQYYNAGPALATNVKVVDVIPTTIKIVSIFPPTSSQTSTSSLKYMTWQIGNFSPNFTNTITMTVTPLQGASGRLITNNTSIKSDNASDWNTTNNNANASFSVSGLEIEKSIPITTTYVGVPFTYTLKVTNSGTTKATGVTVSDLINRGLTVTTARMINPTKTCSISNNWSCSIGDMNATQVSEIFIGVRGNQTITFTKTITNQALIRASPSIIRESEVVTLTQMKPAADFLVTNTDGLNSVTPGQVVTYTVTVQNIGSVITHTNFLVTDTLAAYLDFVSLNLGTLVYTPTFISSDNRVHVWRIGEKLDPNEAISYKITGKVQSNAPVGNYTNHRVVARSPDEKYLGNNTAVDQNLITVQPTQDYNFVLKIDRTRVEVGEGIRFGITLSNVGTTIPVNAKVTDIFPSVLDIVDAETSVGTLTTNASTRTVTVNIGSFSPGQTVEIEISTKVNASATTSAVYEHTSVLTFNPNVSIDSNTVEFSIFVPDFKFKLFIPFVTRN